MSIHKKPTHYCDFCGKSQDEVDLVIGPGVDICESCAGMALDTLRMARERAEADSSEPGACATKTVQAREGA